MYRGFLTEEECEHLIELAKPALRKSTVVDVDTGGSVGSEVRTSSGMFLMRSDVGDEDELPDHLVFIQSFYLDQHEVTNENYSKCLTCERGHGGFDTRDPQQPVVYVDWNNADAYCQQIYLQL